MEMAQGPVLHVCRRPDLQGEPGGAWSTSSPGIS